VCPAAMSGRLLSRAKVIFAVTILSLGLGLLTQAQGSHGAARETH